MQWSRWGTVAVVALLLSLPSAAGVIVGRWSEGSLQIDGNSADWNIVPQVTWKDVNGTIAVQNDADYLYLLIRFRDPGCLASCRRSGLTIWTNHENKKKKTLGFTYRSRTLIEQFRSKSGGGAGPDEPAASRRERAAEPLRDEIIIRDNEQFRREMLPADGSRGIRAAYEEENGIYQFEIGIPLALSPTNSFAIGTHSGEKICIGLECGGGGRMRREEGEPGSPEGMKPGIRGGAPGGMGGMGGRPGGGTPPDAKFGKPSEGESFELWLKLKLAEKP